VALATPLRAISSKRLRWQLLAEQSNTGFFLISMAELDTNGGIQGY
jgi:hypothetical protein